MLLLAASCYFYMAFIPVYIAILFFTIAVDYAAGILIEEAAVSKKRMYLVASIVANVGVLCVFKYANFFLDNVSAVSRFFGAGSDLKRLDWILPIGLSFHTFQSLSYTIEVYKGRQKAERHLGIFALYVMFYPQLVAGPIERPQNLLPQFRREHAFDYRRIADGLKLMAWGLFKKVVIADKLAVLVDRVYSHPQGFDEKSLAVATALFAYQIFCDFSGYSDMALGAAQVMGFRLVKNFDNPYGAKSIPEFWSRWHISLSTWFRDYVYIPLGGSRLGPARWALNILATFALSGLWHGSKWTFIIWGGLNGAYVLLSKWMEWIVPARVPATAGFHSLPGALLRRFATFVLICFSWIFFRSNSIQDAFYSVPRFFTGLTGMLLETARGSPFASWMADIGIAREKVFPALLAILILEVFHHFERKGDVWKKISGQPFLTRWALYYCLIGYIILFGEFDGSQFIYFQF